MPKGMFSNPLERAKKISEARKGYKQTEENKKRISKTLKGRKGINAGKKLSEEWKSKISKSMKGKHHTEETKRKLSESNKGKFRSEEYRRNISEAKRGEKNSQWRGGLSFNPYVIEWTDDLRESIRKRDDYICQLCGIHKDELIGRFKKLDVHHIDYNKDNLNPCNLITLCRKCHSKTNFDREKWFECIGDIKQIMRLKGGEESG